MGAAGNQAGAAVAAGSTAATAGIGAIGKAANTAQEAMGALVAAAQAKLPALGQVAAAQADALRQVVAKGGDAVQVFGRQLPEAISKLSGPELEAFRASMVSALEQTESGARRAAAELQAAGKSGQAELAKADAAAVLLRNGLAAVGRQAAQSLGVDVAAASNTVTQEFVAQQAALAALVKSLPALAAQGVDTGAVVRQALGTMIDSAKNSAEIDAEIARFDALGIKGSQAGELLARALDKRLQAATTEAAVLQLRGEFEKLGGQGRISGQQMADGLDKVRSKLDEIRPGINSLQEAAKLMGIKTREEMQRTATDTQQAWDVIRNSTLVGLDQKVAAFARYREAAIAANGGVESAQVRLQGAMLGTAAQAAGLGDAFARSMGQASTAIEGARGRVAALAEETNAAGERINQLAAGFGSSPPPAPRLPAATPAGVQSGFTMGAQSGTIGSVQLRPPTADGKWVFDQEAFNREQNGSSFRGVGQAINVAPDPTQYNKYWRRTDAPAALGSLGFPAPARGGSPTPTPPPPPPAPSPTPAATSPADVRVFDLRLGQLSARVTTGTAGDAATLETILRELEEAARRLGGGGP